MNIFSFSETIPAADRLPDKQVLYVSENTPIQLLIARLIIGTVKIENLVREEEITQSTDYLETFYSSTSSETLEKLTEYISSELDIQDIVNFYSNPVNSRKNKKFYERLLNEICHFCYHTNRESHTTAFVYIYRILEVISFAFPLIYASQTDDFKHTYGYLRDYFSDNKGSTKGELGFYKSFVEKTFEINPIKDSSVDFYFSTITDPVRREKIFSKIKQLCDNKIFHPDLIEHDKMSIKFTELSSFIITIRNRFFHLFNRGDANLEADEVFDSDIFFEILNKKCFGWICMIYFEILKITLSQIQS